LLSSPAIMARAGICAGFKYWANPQNTQGYVTWQADGTQNYRLGVAVVGPDQGDGGSGVGQRLIPKPMSIILNFGMSQNWQRVDVASMIFPAEFLIDYVRVYQRRGLTNIGCNPKDYPRAEYITKYLDAYQNVKTTTWNWDKSKNSLYDGGC